jgi:hexosaminidase
LYKEPLVLNQTATLKAVTIINGNPAGKVLAQSFNMNKATFKPVKYLNPCDKNFPGWGEYTLVNGICGTLDFVDGEWQGWQGLNAELIIDLQQLTEIKTISASALQNQIWPFIFLPKKVEFFVSDDGYTFRKVGEAINDIDPLSVPIQRKVFSTSFNPVSANFVKVVVENLGKGPKGHWGDGEPACVFVDEIIIE